MASGQPSQEATTMVDTTPVDQATGSGPPDLFIHLEINHWKPDVVAKIEEYGGLGRLESQKYKVACDYQTFQSDMVDCGIPAKFEYLHGFAEITVFASTIIHNAIGMFPWGFWIRNLPDHPTLQAQGTALPGLDILLDVNVDSLVTYKADLSDNKRVDFAADIQIGTFLNDDPQKPGIIIEVAYSESFKHAKAKAKEYLFADKPRPSVVVIFNYAQKQSADEYRNVELKFEVLRRHETIPGDLEVFEQGYAWPPAKVNVPSNTQYITFSLEEIFGNLEVIQQGIEIQQDLSKAPSPYHLDIFEELPHEFLIRLKEKVEMGEVAKLPISYITQTVKAKLQSQKSQDRVVAEFEGTKPKRDEDLLARQEQTFRRR
ncbi:hypothetical protein OEA41_008964 [Lepraria neglecta]|uniref:Uncharacterized protein n=1 Tax=Lepraria neglecta TaxID=209136 RepID=A0AAD9Z0Y0_9LECA|nr:hypothetical protein OEA41_008964 [Lepraria neglecta]